VVGGELYRRPWWSRRAAQPAAWGRASREWRGIERVNEEVGSASGLPKHEMEQQQWRNNGGGALCA
jgi:hypothetical protein